MPERTTIFPDLKEASVLITGGGTGIGAALTEGVARQGARVAFIDIAADPSAALVDRLAGAVDHTPLFLEADFTDLNQLRNACAQADEAHGAVTVLVNNAALDDRHEFLEMSGEYWDDNHAVNLRPVAFVAQAVAPGMIAPGWVMTDRQKRLWVTDEGLAAMMERQCLKRAIEPEDMVGPCLFLASNASAMITAQVLIADGGMM